MTSDYNKQSNCHCVIINHFKKKKGCTLIIQWYGHRHIFSKRNHHAPNSTLPGDRQSEKPFEDPWFIKPLTSPWSTPLNMYINTIQS